MSLGEILVKALMDTLMGMGTVFIILLLICLIISLFKFIPKDEPAKKETPAVSQAVPAVDDSSEEDEVIAAIIAAIRMSLEGQLQAQGEGAVIP